MRSYDMNIKKREITGMNNSGIEELSDLGNINYTSCDYNSDIDIYEKMVYLKPDCCIAWIYLKESYCRLNVFWNSVIDCAKTYITEPDFYESHENTLFIYCSLMKYHELLATCEKAIQTFSNQTNKNKSDDLCKLCDEYYEIKEEYSKFNNLKSDIYESLFNRGIMYLNDENYKEAIRYFKMSLANNTEHITAWNSLGIAYHMLGEYKLAINSYKKAIEINPNFVEAWFNMGITYEESKIGLIAEKCFHKARASS